LPSRHLMVAAAQMGPIQRADDRDDVVERLIRLLHDAHARMGRETLFNVGLPSWRQVKKRLSREGIVRIECDVLHTWQSAYIVVTSSPYSAVTGKSGEFVIEQVPAGTYEIQVWHEKLGKQRRRILVEEGRTSKIEAVFSCAFCETL